MIKHLVWNNTIMVMIDQTLKAGRSVISTTDTVLGLLAACSKQGFESLNHIKGRYEKPYLILVADLNMLQSLVAKEHHERLAVIFQACWPGPLTCIFPAAQNIPDYMQSADGTIGLRIPAHKGLLQLLQLTGPLFSTSANRTGQEIPHQLSDIDAQLLDEVDYLVHEGSQELKPAIASTILDCTKPDIRLVREGAFAIDEIEQKVKLTIKRSFFIKTFNV